MKTLSLLILILISTVELNSTSFIKSTLTYYDYIILPLSEAVAEAETGLWRDKKYRHRLVSSAGAIGIMQIKPMTAKDYCEGLWEEFLFKRYYNIMCGRMILDALYFRCSRDLLCTIRSYRFGFRGAKSSKNKDERYMSVIKDYFKYSMGINIL